MSCEGLTKTQVRKKMRALKALKKQIAFAEREAAARKAFDPDEASKLKQADTRFFKTVSRLFAGTRLEASPLKSSVLAAERLVETMLPRLKNAQDIASAFAAESFTKLKRGEFVTGKRQLRELFHVYRKAGGRLTDEQFRSEVTIAMRHGDKHADSFVQQAAQQRRLIIDKTRDEAREAGVPGFTGDLDVSKFADSYVPRILDKNAMTSDSVVNKDGDNFANMLIRYWNEHGVKNPRGVLDELEGKFLNSPTGRSFDDVVVASGPSRARTLMVPDDELAPWLIDDIDVITEYYQRAVGGDIAILRAGGGDAAGLNIRKAIEREGAERVNDLRLAGNSEAARKLELRVKDDVRDVEVLVDRIRGLQVGSDDALSRVLNKYRKASILWRLPNVALSSIPDIARPIMVLGFARTFSSGWMPVLRNFDAAKLAAHQLAGMGTAIDNEINHTLQRLTLTGRVGDPGFLDKAVDGFSRLTFMRQWNASQKAIAAGAVQAEVLSVARKVVAGTATEKQATRLAALGIDSDVAKRVLGQMEEFGEIVDGNTIPNVANWVDGEASRLYRQAIVKEVDTIIVTPGVGDLPNLFNEEYIKALFQFQSFGLASVQKTLLVARDQGGLQDMAVLQGIVGLVALGMLSDQIKRTVAKDDRELSVAHRVARGVDRSGVLGVFSDWTRSVDVFSGRGLATVALDAGEIKRRGGSPGTQFAIDSFGLPFQDVRDAVNAVHGIKGAVVGDDLTRAQIRAARRFVPLSNWFVTRRLFDRVQERAEFEFNVPPAPLR